jgi:hypothetical protein
MLVPAPYVLLANMARLVLPPPQLRRVPAPCVLLANMARLVLPPPQLRRARHAQWARILKQKVCLCKALALSLLDTCLNLSITPHVCTSGASAHAHSVVLAPSARMYHGKT